MSGGYFEHKQYGIQDIVDEIGELIETNDDKTPDDFGYPIGRGYSQETIEKFRVAQGLLSKAAIYVHRMDWLLSGDDSEDSFHRRLRDDLDKLEVSDNNQVGKTLTGKDDEWIEVFYDKSLRGMIAYKNSVCSTVLKFLYPETGITEYYDIGAKVFWDWKIDDETGQKYKFYYSTSDCKVTVTFPYTPPEQPEEVYREIEND